MGTIKWARVDSVTGKGMNEGYCILDGEMYIEGHMSMLQHITDETDYATIEEAYEDGYYYYTEWDVEDEEYWYEEQADGTLKEIWADEL